MKIRFIETEKMVRKSPKEIQEECDDGNYKYVNEFKSVPRKEPIYIVEMSAKEIQLVSFYLELENRKAIKNIEVKAEIEKENKEND